MSQKLKSAEVTLPLFSRQQNGPGCAFLALAPLVTRKSLIALASTPPQHGFAFLSKVQYNH